MINLFGKIPFSIRPFFWVLAGLIAVVQTPGVVNIASIISIAVWVIVVLVSVLVHELGHAFSALLFGQRVHIELGGFGGITYRFGPRMSLLKEFIVVLMGPVFGLILAFLSYALLKKMGNTSQLL